MARQGGPRFLRRVRTSGGMRMLYRCGRCGRLITFDPADHPEGAVPKCSLCAWLRTQRRLEARRSP